MFLSLYERACAGLSVLQRRASRGTYEFINAQRHLERQPLSALKAAAETALEQETYERLSVITTTLPFENRSEVLGRERLTGARLTYRCQIIDTCGDSDRLQQAQRRRKPSSTST